MMTSILVEQLERAGERVDLIDRRFSRRIDEVGRWRPRKILRAPSLLLRAALALGKQPRVCILFLSSSTGAFIPDFMVGLLSVANRVPLVLYLHTSGFAHLAGRHAIFRWAVRWLAHHASTIAALGPGMSQDFRSVVPEARMIYIPNAVEPPPEGHAAGKRTITFLSNMIPEKGALDFVMAASRLHALHPDVRFVLAGASADSAHSREVVAAAHRLGLDDVLSMRGQVDTDEKWALLRESTLLIFPSTYPREAQPLSIIEAMHCGVPAIAYDVGGVSDIVTSGSGVLVEPNDLEAVVAAADHLLSDPAALDSHRAASLSRARAEHSIQAYDKRWRDLLELV